MQHVLDFVQSASDQLAFWMQKDPWLCISAAGMLVSASYLILMLATKLGDIRRGVQSLLLSGLLHSVLFAFWGTAMVASLTASGGGGETAEEVIPVRQVIVENGTDKSAAAPAGEGNTPVWERMPSSESPTLARSEAKPLELKPIEAPNRTAAAVEQRVAPLPESQRSELQEAGPQPIRTEEAEERAPLADQTDIAEATEEARTESATPGPALTRAAPRAPQRTDVPLDRKPVETEPAREEPLVPSSGGEGVASAPETLHPRLVPTSTALPAGSAQPSGPAVVDTEFADGKDDTATAREAAPAIRFSRQEPARGGGAGLARGEGVERAKPVPVGAAPRSDRPGSDALIASRDQSRALGVGEMPRPKIDRPASRSLGSREGAQMPETYQLRNLPRRQKLAISLGATPASERAVELSLAWLSRHQDADGHWDANAFTKHCPAEDRCWGHAGEETQVKDGGPDRQQAGLDADSGLTALIILAFLGAGYTHEEGEYADEIERALDWLVRQQAADGMLGGKAGRYDRMYCHGMATYALGEACGMSQNGGANSHMREALSRAVQYIVQNQNSRDGGWRYLPGQDGDMSMFGWQLMGLKSAEIAGLPIPDATRSNMVTFLKTNAQGARHGLAGYRPKERTSPSMTAEALFSRQMLGMKRSNPASVEAVEYLMTHLPKRSDPDLYYWYYGTLAMYQYGGEPWKEWNARLRDVLVSSQRQTGHAVGSWDPRDPWGRYGGRLYSTALSTLCLEVYYRFLPLYQLTDRPPEPSVE